MSYASTISGRASLQSWWRLGEGGGSAGDSKGAVTGTYVSATQQQQGIPNAPGNLAASFGGTGTQYVDFGDVYDFAATAAFSIELWIKPSAAPDGNYRQILGKWHYATQGHGWRLYYHTGDGVAFERCDGSGGSDTVSVPFSAAGDWHQVVVTYSGTQLCMYLDGVLRSGPVAATRSLENTTDPLRIANGSFAGAVDEVSVYNAALTATDVFTSYKAGAFVPSPQAQTATTRINWRGKNIYAHGCNMAWFRWTTDFGGGATGLGVADRDTTDGEGHTVDYWIAQMQAASMGVLRWWVFSEPTYLCVGGVPQNHYFTLDGSGNPTGIQANVLADMDAAVAIAKSHNVAIEFVLFDHPNVGTYIPDQWWNTAAGRAGLANALSVLFRRYNGEPTVFAWELGNEWAASFDEWAQASPPQYEAPFQQNGRALIRAFTNAVHAICPYALAVVGAGAPADLGRLLGAPGNANAVGSPLGVDLYVASSYAYRGDYTSGGNSNVLEHNYAWYQTRFGLDAPLVISECQVDTHNSSGLTSTADAVARYQTIYNNGFAGCWGWSATSSVGDTMRIDWSAATQFAAQHTDLGPQAAAAALPSRQMWHGATVDYSYQGSAGYSGGNGYYGQPFSTSPPDPFTQYETNVRKRASVINFNLQWSTNLVNIPFSWASQPMDRIRAHGAIPMVNWGSWDLARRDLDYMMQPNNINSGATAKMPDGVTTIDSFLHTWFHDAAVWGHPFFLRFWWEANAENGWVDGGNFPWCVGTWHDAGSHTITTTAPQWVAAWQRIHDIAVAEGADNISWVWCMNIMGTSDKTTTYSPLGTHSLSEMYPGDAYVDWLSLDGYADAANMPMDQVFRGPNARTPLSWLQDSYAIITAVSPTKPLMIGETGVSAGATLDATARAQRAVTFKDAFHYVFPNMPNLAAVLWFWWNYTAPYWYTADGAAGEDPNTVDCLAYANGLQNTTYIAGNTFTQPADHTKIQPYSVLTQPDPWGTAMGSTGNKKAYWKFNESVGGGTVADSSGAGHSGTVGTGITLGSTPVVPAKPAQTSMRLPGTAAGIVNFGTHADFSLSGLRSAAVIASVRFPTLAPATIWSRILAKMGWTGTPEWALQLLGTQNANPGQIEFIVWQSTGATSSALSVPPDASYGNFAANQPIFVVGALDLDAAPGKRFMVQVNSYRQYGADPVSIAGASATNLKVGSDDTGGNLIPTDSLLGDCLIISPRPSDQALLDLFAAWSTPFVTTTTRTGTPLTAALKSLSLPRSATPITVALSGTLAISGESVGAITDTMATITWATNNAASSEVAYGLTSSYGTTKVDATLVTSHSVTLTGLQPKTTYHYRITSRDAGGTAVNGTDHSFTTAASSQPPPSPPPAPVRAAIFTWIEPSTGVPHLLSGQADLEIVQGRVGLHMPPVDIAEDQLPGAGWTGGGARLRETIYQPRDVDLPLFLHCQDYATLWARHKEIASWFRLRRDATGAPVAGILQCTSPNGDIRQLTAVYKGGLDGREGEGLSGPTFRRLVLQLHAADPMWYAASPSAVTFAMVAGPSFFTAPFLPLKLGLSLVSSGASVLNPGDEVCWPIWQVVGPGTNPVLTNLSTGQAMSLTLALSAGQSVTIDTRPSKKSITSDQSHASLYSALTPGNAAMWPLQPGNNSVQVLMGGTTTASQIVLTFTPAYLGP